MIYIDIEKIKDEKHYLKLALNSRPDYISGLESALSALKDKIASNKFLELIKDKLQTKGPIFYEKQYIQIACELTVNSILCQKFWRHI